MTASRRVLIAGGGIAGLAAAWALHREGIQVLALESRTTLAGAGLAVNLPGNAIAALEELGLADELGEIGTQVRRREYRNERGRCCSQSTRRSSGATTPSRGACAGPIWSVCWSECCQMRLSGMTAR